MKKNRLCNVVPNFLGLLATHFIQGQICTSEDVHEDDIFDILKACHDGPCGRHFVDHRTGHKVLKKGDYWPTIFKDAKKLVQPCDSFQREGHPRQSDEMPLNPQLLIEPFERLVLEFVGLINPSSN